MTQSVSYNNIHFLSPTRPNLISSKYKQSITGKQVNRFSPQDKTSGFHRLQPVCVEEITASYFTTNAPVHFLGNYNTQDPTAKQDTPQISDEDFHVVKSDAAQHVHGGTETQSIN